jgi:hypothetical protein
MSIPQLIELAGELDAMLQSIRSERAILPPMVCCPNCGLRHRAAPPHVSVRALILASYRFGIASRDESRALENAWKRYRQNQQLDLYGRPVEGTTPPAGARKPCQ